MANSLPRLIVLNGWDVIRRQYDRIRGSFIFKTERSGSQCTYMYTELKLEMHKIVETDIPCYLSTNMEWDVRNN